MRKFNRKNFEIRNIKIEKNFIKNADGSCLISYGETRVICTAIIDDDVPNWLKNTGGGWITAEYSMLPGSTSLRNKREAKSGRQSGRTTEIQRLIGRSLRSVVDLKNIGGKSIFIDCDVIEADGGTRTASITGGFVALNLALRKLLNSKEILANPIKDSVAAISCGVVDGQVMIDLDYSEDSKADVDANFVLTEKSGFSEIQATGEESTFSEKTLLNMMGMVNSASKTIFNIQKNAFK